MKLQKYPDEPDTKKIWIQFFFKKCLLKTLYFLFFYFLYENKYFNSQFINEKQNRKRLAY